MNMTNVKTTSVNAQPIVAGTSIASLQGVKIAGKPITISMPMQVVGAPKTVTLSKNTVSYTQSYQFSNILLDCNIFNSKSLGD